MAKKTKFYTVSGMKRVCMGIDTVSYPNLFTSKKEAAKFVADRVNEAIDEFKRFVGAEYEKKTGLKADFYVAEIGDGVMRLA